MTRIFLTIIGAAYVLLAVWCALKPATTSDSVGYALRAGSGQSEYFTVYGGFQAGFGLLLLLPLLKPETTGTMMLSCLIVHVVIVAFRSVSFALYSGITSTTFILAAVEWVILIASAVVQWLSTRS